MAWSTVGSSSASGTGTVTVSKPAGVASGDIILIFLGANSGSPTPPTGFTTGNLTPATGGGGGETNWSDFFYRVADGTEGSTFTINGTAAGWNEIGCVVLRNASADTTTPIDTSAGSVDASATTSPAAPSVTTGRAGNLVLTFFCNSGAGITTLSPPTGQTQIVFWDGDAVINSNTQASAGATGTLAETLSTGGSLSHRYHKWTVSLNVQATGGGAAVAFRRTLGRFGTRAGSRQMVRTT